MTESQKAKKTKPGELPMRELLDKALTVISETKRASTAVVQRKLRLGQVRASEVMEQLEAFKVIGPANGSAPRDILINIDDESAMNTVREKFKAVKDAEKPKESEATTVQKKTGSGKGSKKNPPPVKKEPFKRTLPCALTDAELLDLGTTIADKMAQAERMREDLASHTKRAKGDIDLIDKEIGQISDKLASKRDYREVKCERVKDWNKGTITETRLDTPDSCMVMP